jgi:NAD(P)-dependent dehydrogenase (short-subunit alcohol dehydrogenase family)
VSSDAGSTVHATDQGGVAPALSSDADPSDLARYASYPSLRDRVALVTGGATGIGASVVAHFAAQGARVALLDVLEGPAEQLCDALAARGLARPLPVRCDLRSLPELAAAIDRVGSELGSISVLVNNAAHDLRRPSADITAEEWDEAMSVNLRPHFFTVQRAAPQLRACGGGSVINLGSISAHAHFVDLAPYIAAKAAIEGLTRTLARELGREAIRVNCVVPGWIMTERQRAQWIGPETMELIRRNQCLPFELRPSDVARLVCWLAADDSRACTGQSWIVDGGWI